ncbi:MAG: tetratricopeptide repeat protein, partial [Spirochaetia bacterium]|nr:tetratricopeptide repeat protein [Spirochaetia bacterium]
MDAKMMKKKMGKIKIPALVFSALFVFASCEEEETFSFNYNTILNREFRNNIGRVIPVAYEKAIETGGDISADGKYMYYTSNRENGNYDIYLRDLNDITTVRLTQHAAKDDEPAVSPNGNYLAFVSNRENPEGDIYLLKIDPEGIIKKTKRSIAETQAPDAKAKNLTQITDDTGIVQIVRNSSPAWSPDGKKIAFMSKRGSGEDIWIMNRDGGELFQFTSAGGLYPRYSADGTKIIFISYRDKGSKGDIYIKDIAGGEEKKIDAEAGIKLYPSFLGTNNEIIYTLISRDTNGDGILSLKDDSVIMYYNIDTRVSYPLTLPSQSSFNAKWLMPPWAKSHEGLLLYSDIKGDNIDVNIIPGYGIIPKKTKASYQYSDALQYDEEYDDQERYFLALKRVYYFYGDKKDSDSRIYTARAMAVLWKEYLKKNDRKSAAETAAILESLSREDLYAKAQYERIRAASLGKAVSAVKNIIAQAESQKDGAVFLPYLEEDLAQIYLERGEKSEAMSVLSGIKAKYPNYTEIASVHMEYALLAEKSAAGALSDSAVYTIEKGRNTQKVRMYNHIISLFEKEKNNSKKIGLLNSMLETHKGSKLVTALAQYITALVCRNLKDEKKAIESLENAAASSNINDLLYYRSYLLLSEIYKDSDTAEKYMTLAVTNYKRYFADSSYKNKVRWLVDFYEDSGAQSTRSMKIKEAVSTYDKYRRLIKYIYAYKFFPDIYSIYGPRAHVLYVDAVHLLKKENGIAELETEYSADLLKARIESDKAYIYSLAYIYTLKALEHQDNPPDMFLSFYKSMENIDWALFIDDSFIDPYILKSWIYQYADLMRSRGSTVWDRAIDRYFPDHLWEKNISILERALVSNDENLYPEHEGNIHLNLGNNYFLLVNYPMALTHYETAIKYKKKFDSSISQALFCFHMAYCYWQNEDIDKAHAEMRRADLLYQSFANENNMKNYAQQFYTIYKYYALFSRMNGDYEKAIEDYQNILSFASKYKIKIDRARYFQEIAHCYQELNKYDLAIDALNTAERMLKKYPNDEADYKLNWKWFSVFGFQFNVASAHFFDLGQDGVVIGNNKIFYSLDTRNKKMLNLAMLEDIQLKRSDYLGAIGYLEQKIKLLEGRKNSVDRETLIIAYNNLGYYNARISEYDKAVEYFNKTWDTAKKDGFLEGSFTAIMNLANLYAYMLEHNSAGVKNAPAELDALSERILKYRESYETDAFNSGMEELKADAKKQKRDVTDEETAALKQETAERAKETYYKIDISLGVLDYYKAELKRAALKLPDDAYSLYNEHKELYAIYQRALERFVWAQRTAEEKNDAVLSAKLLLNIGSCYAVMGDADNAYVAFLDAKDAAAEIKSPSLMFNSAAALGLFLKNHGAKTIGRGALPQSQNNLKEAISYVKNAPLLYAPFAARVENAYNALLEIYILNGRWTDAFELDEERASFNRVMIPHFESALFYSEQHRRMYERYADLTKNLQKLYAEAERLALDGFEDASPEMAAALKNIDFGRSALSAYAAASAGREPVMASYLRVKAASLADARLAHAHIIKFIRCNNIIHMWSLKNGKLEHFSEPSESAAQKRMEKLAAAGRFYIVFNPSFFDILKGSPSFLSGIRATLVNSIEQAQARALPPVSTMYYAGGGISDSLPMLSLVTEDAAGEKNPAGYDIIADNLRAPRFTSAALFKTRLNPALLVTSSKKNDFADIFRKAEAAGYAGAAAAVFCSDETAIVQLIQGVEQGTDTLMASNPVAVFGEALKISAGKSDEIMARYRGRLNDGLLTDAVIELNRWRMSAAKTSENTKIYAAEMIDILLLRNDIKGVEAFAGGGELGGLSAAELAVYKIFTDFYKGDVKRAAAAMQAEIFSACVEYPAFKALAGIAASGNSDSVRQDISEYFAKAKLGGNCVSAGRMALLITAYLNLAGEDAEALPGTAVLASDREIAMALSMGKFSFKGKAVIKKAEEIEALQDAYNRGSFNKAAAAIRETGSEDAAAALILFVNRRSRGGFYSELLSSDMLEDVRGKSYWMDRFLLDLDLARFLEARGN